MAKPSIIEDFCSDLKTLPINIPFLLRFRLSGTPKGWGGTDYTVTLSCANRAVTLSTKKVEVEQGWVVLTNIQSSSVGTATLRIEVDSVLKKTILFKFLDSKDVFQKTAITKQFDEFEYFKDFVEQELAPEYDENYCMQASERGLSELLSDTTNFYSVNRGTHTHKNKIGFSGKTAYDRGDAFFKNGFVLTTHTFNRFTIDHDKKNLIYNSADATKADANYKKVMYTIVTLTSANEALINKFFTDDMKDKEVGFHIYYLTVTDGFHTLTVKINKLDDPCNPKYEIWDQHGISSSKGMLSKIADGIRKQTSWTFANTCKNRHASGKTKHFDSTKMKLWKIKKK